MLSHGIYNDTPPLEGCCRGTKVPCSELCEGVEVAGIRSLTRYRSSSRLKRESARQKDEQQRVKPNRGVGSGRSWRVVFDRANASTCGLMRRHDTYSPHFWFVLSLRS